MIYLFNDVKKLTGTVKTNHYRTLLHEREKNGLYTTSVEVPVTYNDKGTVYNYDKKIRDNDFIGYYDKEGRFQLHKIAAYDIEDNFIKIKGIHVFFDEAKAGAIIQDRRFIDREIVDGAIAAFDTIGWQVVDHDVSVKKNYNFYNVSPLEALAILQETFEFEFDYWLTFDGKKVTGKSIAVKEKLGKKRPDKRYVYGHNVLSIRAEQDYSEVYTAVIGRGKGEEITETGGYGRRIEFTDVVWGSNKPLRKPAGSRMLEDENATRLFGYKENGVVKPRIKVEVFSDIESPTELLQASYEWLMANNTPKAVFSLKVPDGDGLDLGDEVYVIYRDIDLVKTARVEKVIDDLKSGRRDVEFGDTAYFNVDRRMKSIENNLKRVGEGQGGAIYNLKKQFDERFNQMVSDYRDEFEQAKIDILAEVEADRARMEAEFNKALTDWANAFNADVEQAYKDAEENYARLEQKITTAVDTTRSELEQGYTDAVEQAKRYAEEQSKAHADAVENKLDAVTGSHAGMLADLQSDVMDIDEFLGDSRSLTLDERFQNITENFEERIRNIDSTHYNIIRGTSFDNPDLFAVHSQVQVITNEVDNFVRMGTGTTNLPYVMNMEYFNVVKGKTYYLVFMYRTTEVPEIDFIEIRPPSEYGTGQNIFLTMTAEEKATVMTGHWTKKVVEIVPDRTMPVRLLLGTNFGAGNTQKGVIDFKKPYLTTTNNREWLPHPDDDTQNVSEIIRRVTLLEDGRSELITRSEYDFDTGNLDQYIKSVEETVEGNKQVLQRVDNWQATNGASIEETIYGFNQKVWLNDISSIGANLIPQSSNAWEDGSFWSSGEEATDSTTRMNIRMKESIPLILGERYTLSDYSKYVSAIKSIAIHQWDNSGRYVGLSWVGRGETRTFTAIGTRLRISIHAMSGFTIPTSFIDHPDGRIKIKLEVGDKATPMLNAISRIEQLADKIELQVQELDGEFLTQSDIQVKAGYVQIGSQQIGDEQFASIFRVSPKSIDAIADNLNITGNVNISGQVTTLAVNALEGRFSNLWASELEATTILAKHIGTEAIQARHILASNALVGKLVANEVFADEVTTKALNAIEINAGRVRAAILEADVITGTHLAVGTSMINKLFATSGRIDQLITKSHFVSNMKALSIEAVEGNFSSLITKYFSANYIDVDWIDGKNAWFESMYTSNAMIRKLTAQTVFVRDVQAIEITANQLNLDTLRNRFNKIEGGIHITRAKDGVRWIENGVPRGNVPVQTYDSYAGSNIRFNGLNFITDNSHWQTFKYFYTPHEGRILRVVWAVGLLGSSGSASEYVEVQVNGFGNNNQINNGSGSSSRRVFVSRGNTVNITQDIPLPPPNYNMMQAYLQVRRSPSGTGITNDVFARILHIGQYG